jgi:hypothetical protein
MKELDRRQPTPVSKVFTAELSSEFPRHETDPAWTMELVTDKPDFTLALEEARRNLDALDSRLTDIRDRSLQLVSVGGLAASFVGGLSALASHGPSVWSLLAVTLFTLIVAVCLWIWLPRGMWISQEPSKLVDWAEVPAMTRQRMDRSLALHLGAQYEDNKKSVDRMLIWFRIALILLGAEVVCLAIGLWIQ